MLGSMNETSRCVAIVALVLGAYGLGASAARADLKSVLEREKEAEQASDPGVTPEPAESPLLQARFHRVDPAQLALDNRKTARLGTSAAEVGYQDARSNA